MVQSKDSSKIVRNQMVIQTDKKFSTDDSTSLKTPVLFLIFNRPETTYQVFSSIISLAKQIERSKLYLRNN